MTADRPDVPDRRSDARERALYVMYEAAQKGVTGTSVLASQVVAPDDLTTVLVTGVETHRDRLDEVIAAKAAGAGWTLARMPVLDLSVLRLATFELIERLDVPVAVVIDEAVELAKRFSTDNSGRFVNGVLASLARDLRRADDGPVGHCEPEADLA